MMMIIINPGEVKEELHVKAIAFTVYEENR